MQHKIIILTLSLLAVSCTEFLDVKPRGYDIPATLEQYVGMIYGQEYGYSDEVFEYMSFEFGTDAAGYGNAYANLGSASCNAFCWKKDIFLPDENSGEWNSPASFMYPLNVVIAEVMQAETGTQEQKKAVLAEARMVRAWLHFMMAQHFGKPYDASTAATDRCIPIITKATTVDASFPLCTVAEVYDFILSEMEASIPDLLDQEEHFLRVFKSTGNAMMGKVLWMTGRYPEAEPFLEAALEQALAQGRSLLDYNEILTEDGELDYPSDAALHPEYMFLFGSMPRLWLGVYTTYYQSAIFNIRNDVLFRYFTQGDIRLAQLTGIRSGKTAYASFRPNDVYSANISNIVSNMGIGLPDVYLMYAECLARNGKEHSAYEVLKQFRASRMDPAAASQLPDDMVQAAVEERIREYIGFGNIWYDMRRLWNDPGFQYLKDYYTRSDGKQEYTLTEDRLVMEIPPLVLSWHPEYNN